MSKSFPTVGLIASVRDHRLFIPPALALGVELVLINPESSETINAITKDCDVVTLIDGADAIRIAKNLEAQGVTVRPTSLALSNANEQFISKSNKTPQFSVLVARSPHGQATTWAPAEIITRDDIWVMSITPAPGLSEDQKEKAQQLALDFSAHTGLVGVVAVGIAINDGDLSIVNVESHPHSSGNWTIDGSITNQYEQHLRAVLDLPLGDPAMTSKYVVTGNIYGGDKPNMYRPYLHLMARTPAMKFHQYKNTFEKGALIGHLTLTGSDQNTIIEELKHALEYMQGEIDE